MSTATKTSQSQPSKPTPRTGAKTTKAAEQTFLFDRENYMWMIGGVVLIILGFMLMSGGKSPNPNEFHYEEVYSFRRITLAPIVVLLGFAVEIYAIMKKPKEINETPVQP
jgi:hypothetical protein